MAVYFIRTSDGSRVKIGTTIRLSVRLKQLAKEVGQPLEVLAVVEGGRDEERSLHQRFSHLRVVNEWFEPGDDLMGFIVAEGKPWDGQDEVPLEALGVTAKIDAKIGFKAKLVAAHRNITVNELISGMLREPIDRALQQCIGEIEASLSLLPPADPDPRNG